MSAAVPPLQRTGPPGMGPGDRGRWSSLAIGSNQYDCGVLELVRLPRSGPNATLAMSGNDRARVRNAKHFFNGPAREETGELFLKLRKGRSLGADDSHVGHGQTVALESDGPT